jgi:aminoglycoside 6'-N-acetyltransferase I
MMRTAMTRAVHIRILGKADGELLQACAEDVFDEAVSSELAMEFPRDARHHIVAAIAEGTLVGLVSAVHYVHPDKAPELSINEVSVAESHRGQGIGKRLLMAMLSHGRTLGCTEA